MSTRGAEVRQADARKKKAHAGRTRQNPSPGASQSTEFLTAPLFRTARSPRSRPRISTTLREARRKALYNVSDESLSEYLAYTQLMIRLLNRLDLYKDYRAH